MIIVGAVTCRVTVYHFPTGSTMVEQNPLILPYNVRNIKTIYAGRIRANLLQWTECVSLEKKVLNLNGIFLVK